VVILWLYFGYIVVRLMLVGSSNSSWILHCTNEFIFLIFRRNVVFLSLRLRTKTGLLRPEGEGIKIIRNFEKCLLV
jgi:hypothetical protein